MEYLYDGSFEGFLTCIHAHYYQEKAEGIYRQDQYQATFLSRSRFVPAEERKATTVYEAIEEKISREDLKRIYRVFLSADGEKENKLLKYIRLGFQCGSKISAMHSHPIVCDVWKWEKKVSVESYRMIELARFSALRKPNSECNQEILYCCIEPDHDVLELIGDHFADRLKNDPFIIHDKKRGKGIFCQGGQWFITEFTEKEFDLLGKEEQEYRDLWKHYFQTIAIQERINPICQKRMMPVRYWKNLTEFR